MVTNLDGNHIAFAGIGLTKVWRANITKTGSLPFCTNGRFLVVRAGTYMSYRNQLSHQNGR